MDDFEREIKTGFLDEAAQMLEDVEQAFLVLEQDSSSRETLEKIFRLAHNLKGSGRAVGFEELAEFTHKFESLLLKLKNGELVIQSSTVGLLLRCKDHIGTMVEGLRGNLEARFDSRSLVQELEDHISGRVSAPSVESLGVPSASAFPEEESVPTPAPADTPAAPVAEISLAPVEAAPAKTNKNPPADESLRVSLARVEKLINFVGELVIMESVLRQQTEEAGLT